MDGHPRRPGCAAATPTPTLPCRARAKDRTGPGRANPAGKRAGQRTGNVWDNATMESFFSSFKTERIRGKVYRAREAARARLRLYREVL